MYLPVPVERKQLPYDGHDETWNPTFPPTEADPYWRWYWDSCAHHLRMLRYTG
jgi:hypothetical protein